VFLQGGVAKNEAVPLAFAMMLDKEILVPPVPRVRLGCFGVVPSWLNEKKTEGLLDETTVDIDALLEREIGYERVFTCKSCDNYCPIQVLKVNGHSYMFGGRCNKYTNMRKTVKDVQVFDYVERRQKLIFEEFAPPAGALRQNGTTRWVFPGPFRFTASIPCTPGSSTSWALKPSFPTRWFTRG